MDPSHPQEPVHAASLFNTYAAAYLEKYGDISCYHPLLDRFADAVLKTGNKLLDIACGPGLQLEYLQQRHPGLKLTGTDLAPNMIALAKERVPAAELLVQDCCKLSRIPDRYEGVIGSFLLPYLDLSETQRLIGDISRLLDPGGCVYLGFISGKYEDSQVLRTSGGETVMMHYYEEATITGLLAAAGIRILHREEMSSPDPRQLQKDIILIGEKQDS